MESQTPNKFDEATLLAYVEQTMTGEERAAFEAAVGSDPKLLASLRRMQADCDGLRAMPAEQPPVSLVADVLASVERSMLLETDLVAPPIDMRRYRASHWQRYAAAAGFTLLLTGGGFMLFQTLRFDSRDDVFAPDAVVNNGAVETSKTSTETPAAEPGHASEMLVIRTPERGGATDHETQSAAESFEAAMVASANPAVIAAIDRQWPTDLDLYANVVTADPAAAFETIAKRLRSRGGDLIVNATLNVPAGLPAKDPGREHLAGTDQSRPLTPNLVGPIPTPVPMSTGPVVADPDDRVPLAEQSRYAARGYQFTLLGTPTDILSTLRELGADRSLRVSWSRQGAGRLLVDLVAPNLPPETRWDHVMFWWVDPAARFDEARAAVAQASTEPFIRIPVRIIQSGRR